MYICVTRVWKVRSHKNNFGKEIENFKSLTPFETLKLNFTSVKTLQIINM